MERRNRPVGQPYYSNCRLAMLILKYRGKISSIKKVRGNHYLGKLRDGRHLHFKAKNPWLHRNPYKSRVGRLYFFIRTLWFKGQLEVLRKRGG